MDKILRKTIAAGLSLALLLSAPGSYAAAATFQSGKAPVGLEVNLPLGSNSPASALGDVPLIPPGLTPEVLGQLGINAAPDAVTQQVVLQAALNFLDLETAVKMRDAQMLGKTGIAENGVEEHAAPADEAHFSRAAALVKRLADSVFTNDALKRIFRSVGTPKSLVEAPLDIPSDAQYTPSPDWSGVSVNRLFTTRYAQSHESVTQGKGDPEGWQGGTLEGVKNSASYIGGISDAVMLTPWTVAPIRPLVVPWESKTGWKAFWGYHGYHTTDAFGIDPRLGSVENAQALVREFHGKGKYVISDVTLPYMGQAFDYKEGDEDWDGSMVRKDISWNPELEIFPVELRHPDHWERLGVRDVTAGFKTVGETFHADFIKNMRKLNLYNPETRKIVIHALKWWIKTTDIDGMRIDAWQHVPVEAREEILREIGDYAAKLGKKNFLFILEVFNGDYNFIKDFIQGGPNRVVYDYAGFFKNVLDTDKEEKAFLQALYGTGPTKALADTFAEAEAVLGKGIFQVIHFLDNPDKPRFAHAGQPARLWKLILDFFLFALPGLKYMQYGTERIDLEKFQSTGVEMLGWTMVARPAFFGLQDKEAPFYRHLEEAGAIRDAYPALRRGWPFVRASDPNGPGIFAVSRIIQGNEGEKEKEVLFIMNNSQDPYLRRASPVVDKDKNPPFTTVFRDERDSAYEAVVYPTEQGSKVDVQVPSLTGRILVPERAKWAALWESDPVLVHGKMHTRFMDPGNLGVRAYSYILDSAESLVVLNTARPEKQDDGWREVEMWVDANASRGATFEQIIPGTHQKVWAYPDGGGWKVKIKVPPGFFVFRRVAQPF